MQFSGSPDTSDDAKELELYRLARIVEDSDDAIVSKDLTGRITSWNRAAEQMFGYSADEMIGRSILILFPERLSWEEETILGKLRRGERIEHYDTVRVRKDGREIDVAITVSPMRGPDGEVVGASKIMRDITEAKRLRIELEELRRELTHVARLNDMGQLAAAFAHELNQPLSAIGMYLGGVRRLLGTGDLVRAQDGCDKVAKQAERIGEVIRRLRNFVAKRQAERRPEDLAPLIDEAAALALLGRHVDGVRLTVDIAEDARRAVVDKVQVQQVLINLMRNAAEAMAGRPRQEIAVATRRPSLELVQVEVADTGPGLDPEIMQRLFQPFTTTKPEGMGVGLSLCRNIIADQGGDIAAGNRPEGGAWFRFTLPAD